MEGVDWSYLLDGSSGSKSYSRCRDELSKRGLYGPQGVATDTMQRGFKIMLYQNDAESFKKNLNGLKEILPFVKPITTGDYAGYKYIDVFEHTLSEYGSYWVIVNEELIDCRLMQDRWHRTYEIKKFDTLEKLLAYMWKHHYYK